MLLLKRSLWLLPLLVVISCSGIKGRLVGQWTSDDQTQTVEFFRDGTVVFRTVGIPVTGRWHVMDERHVRFDLSGPVGALVGTQVAKVTVQEDRLVLEFEIGISNSYTRAK